MAEETTAETPITPGTLVPQPHGGALRYGGTNKGGPGRPPDKFRKLARKLLHERKLLPRLADIAEAKIGEIHHDPGLGKVFTETPLREQRGAIDSLIKLGIGPQKQYTEDQIRERLAATAEIIRSELGMEKAMPIFEKLKEVWK